MGGEIPAWWVDELVEAMKFAIWVQELKLADRVRDIEAREQTLADRVRDIEAREAAVVARERCLEQMGGRQGGEFGGGGGACSGCS